MDQIKTLWKSAESYYDSSSTNQVTEFADSVTNEFNPDTMSGVSRRKFLALVSAGTAFAATACTNYRDKKEIVEYVNKPDSANTGLPNYYASTCTECPLACGIVIKTREGRPIKIDGNELHPINLGKTCVRGQGTILNLYDPIRLKKPSRGSKMLTEDWKTIDEELIALFKKATSDKKEIAILHNTIFSPSQKAAFNVFIAAYPTAKLYCYENFCDDSKREAFALSYSDKQSCCSSASSIPFKLNQAKVILSLESDFLGNEGHFVRNIKQFSETRDVNKLDKFSRLYVAEAGMSLTGMNSDYRLRLTPEKQLDFLLTIISAIAAKHVSKFELPLDFASKLNNYNIKKFADENGIKAQTIDYLVDDLIKNTGSSCVISGNKLPKEVHIAANLINEMIEAQNLCDCEYCQTNYCDCASDKDLTDMLGRAKAGQVAAIINFDSNPVYQLPQEFGYSEASSKTTVITLSEFNNETSSVSHFVLPINHNLESWGDANTNCSVFSLQQPVIAPLYDTRQKEAVLLIWASGKADYNDKVYLNLIKDYWQKEVFPKSGSAADFDTFWYSCLHDGVVEIKSTKCDTLKFNFDALKALDKKYEKKDFTLLINDNPFFGTGKFVGNGWLQELPHPVTKLTWDNCAMIAPATAKELGVEMGDFIEVSSGNNKLKIPAFHQPGMAEKTIAIDLGYGRKNVGEIGSEVGFDVSPFISSNGISKYIYSGVTVVKGSGHYKLATTQEHHSLDEKFVKDLHLKRGIVREGTVEEYKTTPNFLKEKFEEGNPVSIHSQVSYTGMKWAMALDMNKCVGCALCVQSCNVENNIPVVGKDQVANGREMHWMRVDRYYSGTTEEPIVSQQPINCSHCDNAPCENVCPVVATSHSPDGLNQMVYNRCVGTRYCANNCPTKVRRYNFFDFREHFAQGYYTQDSLSLLHNPEVTVRSRSVMEKCTFCIQRIMEGKQEALKAGKDFKGSDVKTACQVACPAEAISFGDVNDPESDVAKIRKHDLSYSLLDELYIKSNVHYIARLRNTNSEKNSER
ncbi:MAG: Fe-S-cluster-containing hydrogenase [Candidatus Kapabacteria bacterium]|nr:Fe-S-cluster-containing hydrogenase [Candidatus Kapabacteria bacterium]